jgi:hypothetical protein
MKAGTGWHKFAVPCIEFMMICIIKKVRVPFLQAAALPKKHDEATLSGIILSCGRIGRKKFRMIVSQLLSSSHKKRIHREFFGIVWLVQMRLVPPPPKGRPRGKSGVTNPKNLLPAVPRRGPEAGIYHVIIKASLIS